jgi:hypothetical protein
MGEVPQELNWVKARAACSLRKVFAELYRDVEEDVKLANAELHTSNTKRPFEITKTGAGDAFLVHREEAIRPTVRFELSEDAITVISDLTNETAVYDVGLNDEGRCMLRSKQFEEFERWQVRRRALEALFFRS